MSYRVERDTPLLCHLCDKTYIYNERATNTRDTCSSCMGNRHRFKLKADSIVYKGGKCVVCGYCRCQRALTFHHVNEDEKEFDFGGKHNLGWDRLRAELDKCVLICENCHREAHDDYEYIRWHPAYESEVICKIKEAHAAFVPDPTVKFTRSGWEDYHPKYKMKVVLVNYEYEK